MTISFVGIGTKSTLGTTSVGFARPASFSDGDMLVNGRVGWLSGFGLLKPAGWTGEGNNGVSGGTGTAVDNHTTTVKAMYKPAFTGEASSHTFPQQSGITGVTGHTMCYTKDPLATWDIAFDSGSDNNHGSNRTALLSEFSYQVGDMLIAVVAVDTDTALTITSPVFGGTVGTGTVNRRSSGTGSTTGNDGNIEVFDALVTTSGILSSFTFSTSTAQCGPVQIVRLREIFPAPPPSSGWGIAI